MAISSTVIFSIGIAGAEAVLKHGIGADVAQFGLDEGAQVSRACGVPR